MRAAERTTDLGSSLRREGLRTTTCAPDRSAAWNQKSCDEASWNVSRLVLRSTVKTSSRHLLVGFFDEPHTLYGEPAFYFPILQELHAQVLRVNLYWGGKFGVANRKPYDGSDPADPAYNWGLYDRLVSFAS